MVHLFFKGGNEFSNFVEAQTLSVQTEHSKTRRTHTGVSDQWLLVPTRLSRGLVDLGHKRLQILLQCRWRLFLKYRAQSVIRSNVPDARGTVVLEDARADCG